MIVVSDTSPINYLILIEQINLLPELFGEIIIPQAVKIELSDLAAPDPVQTWINQSPEWLKIQLVDQRSDEELDLLDLGESATIFLAEKREADLILLDDMKARQIAKHRGLTVTGILGILDAAARRQMIDLPVAVKRLQNTSFWASNSLYQRLLDTYKKDC